jgi:uncharacterized glyoxalase superfamily protein PhnB
MATTTTTSEGKNTPAAAGLQLTASTPGLTVNDLDRSVAFYTGVGFTIDDRWEQDGKLLGVMMKAGKCQLGLSQDDWAKGKDRVKGVGLRLWFNTDQDIDEIARRAKAAGITLDQDVEDMPWGARAFMLTDPDGFKLTISKEA